ncbi:zinc finger BED domain-containing protein RICESLEEPER 2-like [Nicotiana tomentosiformis]|uniref:zinc finger BED domain-containing protein RICESLEEPER 2-like n=1 Tax=Nicotiana tomentosiformis TaxID=4098 RepID=UPI00388CBDC8
MAHILNLIVQDGLKEIDASVTRVRNIVRYVRSLPARTLKFKQCCTHVKVECTKTLCLDVPTRWNSTYLMLDTAQNFEKAFDKFHFFDDRFSAYLCSHLCEDGSSASSLESDDWVNVRNLIAFLARFHELTKKVSGSRYVTCNSHFEDVSKLYCHLKMCLISEDEHLRKMAERMQEKFKKYWGEPEKMIKIIFIASILDPRNKFEYVSLAFEEHFGEEKGKKINVEVYAYMNSLFEEYLKTYSTGSCPQSPSSSTSSNNTSNASSRRVITASLIRTKLYLKKQKKVNGSRGAKSELDKYISEEQEPFSEEFYILKLARDVLAIPISSVASECAFRTGGRILDSFRSSLTPKCVQALLREQEVVTLSKEASQLNVQLQEAKAKWSEVQDVVLVAAERMTVSIERVNNLEAALNSKVEEVAATEEKCAKMEDRYKKIMEHNKVHITTIRDLYLSLSTMRSEKDGLLTEVLSA